MQKPAILLHMSVDLKSLVDGLVHAARARPVPPSGGAVGTLQQLVADDLTAINSLIVERIFSEVGLIPDLAQHLIASGGKRLRPLVTLATARLCGYEGEGHVKLAASVELMHTATLLHDDVVDGQDLRRGRRTARMIWGNQASVLVGDFLLGRAFRMMVEVGSLRALEILSSAASVIAEGEVLQLAATARDPKGATEESYLRIIESKTAELFAAAAELGAVVAGRSNADADALRRFGMNMGVAFQIVDDALDYAGATTELGKEVGQDFKEGKVTLPVILAFRRGTEEEQAFWTRTLHRCEQHDGDFHHAVSLLEKHTSIQDSIDVARHYGQLAVKALETFPDGTHKVALINLVHYGTERTH